MAYKQMVSQGLVGGVAVLKNFDVYPDPAKMTFVVATDTHSQDVSGYPDGQNKNIYGGFTKQYADLCAIVERINPDFYLHTGDLIEEPLSSGVALAQSSLQGVARNEDGISCPIYHIAGNHDTNFFINTELESQQFYAELNDAYVNNPQGENFTSQEDVGYYHATRGDLHLLNLNGVNRDTGRPDAYYDIDATQQAWFISELATIPDGSNIVISSHLALRINLAEYQGSSDPKEITIVPATITAMENALISHLTTNKNTRMIGWFGGHAHESMREQVAISTSGGQSELNYFTTARGAFSTQSKTYKKSNLSYSVIEYDKDTKNIIINGFGNQASYDITY